MEWTPGEIKKLSDKIGGVEILAEILRVTPKTILNMIYGAKQPSKGAGIAILNLVRVLDESLSTREFARILLKLRALNADTPSRIRKKTSK